MKRLLYLAILSLVATLLLAAAAWAQTPSCADADGFCVDQGTSPPTVVTVPLNPDGTCPEGFVTVNEPFCAQESPNTPGRVFGFGEGDLAPAAQPAAPAAQAPTATTEQYTPAAPQTPAQPQAPAMTDLPSTGGPALLIPAAGLLLATGLISIRAIRRRS